MADSHNKPVCRQLRTNVSAESNSSSEEEEIPQFNKGILKQIEKMERLLKKHVEEEQIREKEDSKQNSGNGEEDESGLQSNVKKVKN